MKFPIVFALQILLLTLLYLLFAGGVVAQQEGSNWYFGHNAGIRFTDTGLVVLTDGQIYTEEGVATISDKSGGLLFYTDGITVWNREHSVMPNGTGLLGHISSTQSAIIVAKIGDPMRFYLFTVDAAGGPNGLNYSVINISLDNGRGDIEIKNIPMMAPVTEKITAVKHCNGKYIWVIVHGWNSDLYYAYLITETGINIIPVNSSSGRTVGGNPDAALGYLKASPDGKKLAAAHNLLGLDLLDFNNATGVVSNRKSLFTPSEII